MKKMIPALEVLLLTTLAVAALCVAVRSVHAVEPPPEVTTWITGTLMTPEEADQRYPGGTLPDLVYTGLDAALTDLALRCNTATIGASLDVFTGAYHSGRDEHDIHYPLLLVGRSRETTQISATIGAYKYLDVQHLTLRGGPVYTKGTVLFYRHSSGKLNDCVINSGVQVDITTPVDVTNNSFINLHDLLPDSWSAMYITSVEEDPPPEEPVLTIRMNEFIECNRAIDAGFIVNAGTLLERGDNSFVDCAEVIYSRAAPSVGTQSFRGNFWAYHNAKTAKAGELVVLTDEEAIKDRFVPVNRTLVDVGDALEYDVNSRTADADADGLSNWQETYVWKTDPEDPDSDHDGFSDGQEVSFGFNPLDPADPPPGTNLPATSSGWLAILVAGLVAAGIRAARVKQRKGPGVYPKGLTGSRVA